MTAMTAKVASDARKVANIRVISESYQGTADLNRTAVGLIRQSSLQIDGSGLDAPVKPGHDVGWGPRPGAGRFAFGFPVPTRCLCPRRQEV